MTWLFSLKAYSIQQIEAPLFDNLLIMLGNFHNELAFYGAVGTYLNECGIEFILSEASVLAEGSMMMFMKGKSYNRCVRIHEILATALEQKLFDKFKQSLSAEDQITLECFMSNMPDVEGSLQDPVMVNGRPVG